MKQFIGTKIIKAEPQPCQKDIHLSKIGDAGYKVEYEDGYISWCPAIAFEEAYREAEHINFGLAMEAMIKGRKCIRAGWNGNGMYCEAQIPDNNSKMTHPYLYLTIPGCQEGERRLPWQPAQVDIFATDWQII